MGRWMQVLEKEPAAAQGVGEGRVIAEMAPYALMHAFTSLCKANPGKREAIRTQFPMLASTAVDSDRYADETLTLKADETRLLLQEVERLRRVCRREEYIQSLDGPASYVAWRGAEEPEEFERSLDDIMMLRRQAVSSAHIVRLML